ncbi:unnamed protein product [Brassica oleracea]
MMCHGIYSSLKYLQRSWISTLLASLCFWTHKLLLPRTLPSTSFVTQDASETVAMVKELLETCIRPAVQDDVGDIEYCGFDPESGIVKLRLQGAYSGCPSSSVTLKSGIESMLMHYVPEDSTS